MPKPKKEEKKSDFISRCVKRLSKENKNYSRKHKLGKCFGIWKNKKK